MSGELEAARSVLERAVAMDPEDELAANNLRACNRELDRDDRDEGRLRRRHESS